MRTISTGLLAVRRAQHGASPARPSASDGGLAVDVGGQEGEVGAGVEGDELGGRAVDGDRPARPLDRVRGGHHEAVADHDAEAEVAVGRVARLGGDLDDGGRARRRTSRRTPRRRASGRRRGGVGAEQPGDAFGDPAGRREVEELVGPVGVAARARARR